MDIPFLGKQQTLEEAEEEGRRLDVTISNKQKKLVLAKLKEHDLTLASFGGSIKSAIAWLKGR